MAGEPMNSCILLVMTDGRDNLLEETINSATENLKGSITRRVIHADNGLEHLVHLQMRYPDWEIIGGERLGFGGAINRAWSYIAQAEESCCLHLEDDFLFTKPVPLNGMMKILSLFTYLSQIVLCRQPWNEPERKAGGIVEQGLDRDRLVRGLARAQGEHAEQRGGREQDQATGNGGGGLHERVLPFVVVKGAGAGTA